MKRIPTLFALLLLVLSGCATTKIDWNSRVGNYTYDNAIAELGVDVMTSGNHIWDKKEAIEYIPTEPRLLRPANYPAGVPGRGSYIAQSGDGRAVGVINVMGRVFMLNVDDPFQVVLMGMTFEKKGDQAKARELFEKAFDMATGSNPPNVHSRAFTRKKLGR